MIRMILKNGCGEILVQGEGREGVELCAERVYQQGDVWEIHSDFPHLLLRMDTGLMPGEVYIPSQVMHWPVPSGEDRNAYAPGLFEMRRHFVSAHVMTEQAIHGERLISLNPSDLKGHTDFYPHCTANVETRSESCFAARNVIDGYRINHGHGEWPYQSWGIGTRQDACLRLEFGRTVEISRVALTLRADFPHDAWWQSVRLRMSDGGEQILELRKTDEAQMFEPGTHRCRWVELDQLVKAEDPSPFPSLTQLDVYGRDP